MCRLAKQESNKANLLFAGENICYHVAAFYDHILTPPSGSGGGGGHAGKIFATMMLNSLFPSIRYAT